MKHLSLEHVSDALLLRMMQCAATAEQYAISGDAAFAELYERHGQHVLMYCVRVLGSNDDGHDIFQETFVRLFKVITAGERIANVPAYLITIARNLCLNHKRNRKDCMTIEEFAETFQPPVTLNHEQEELLRLIELALEYLDFDHREAFILRQYHEYSYEEIAAMTGTTVTTVTNRIWRAKERVKKILAPQIAELNKFT